MKMQCNVWWSLDQGKQSLNPHHTAIQVIVVKRLIRKWNKQMTCFWTGSLHWNIEQPRKYMQTWRLAEVMAVYYETYKSYDLDRGSDWEEWVGGEAQITEINQNLIPPPLPYQPWWFVQPVHAKHPGPTCHWGLVCHHRRHEHYWHARHSDFSSCHKYRMNEPHTFCTECKVPSGMCGYVFLSGQNWWWNNYISVRPSLEWRADVNIKIL